MSVFIYRVLRRTPRGAEVMAEIRGQEITGRFAELVRERLVHFGYPAVPVAEALLRFRASAPGNIGFELVEEE